jgi:tyrosine-protein kinase Etk/Wzc
VRKAFFGLYEIQKTKRDAITISIEDQDKQQAAQMANAVREKIDKIAQRLIKESQWKAINAYEATIKNKVEELSEISDTLTRLRRRFGIYNTEAQSESLTEQFAKAEAKLIRNRTKLEALRENPGAERDSIINLTALVKGQEEEVQSLEKRLEMLNSGMPIVNILHKQYLEANQSLGEDRERYKVLVSTYESNIPATILVEPATMPLIKSRPKRSIIVLASVAIVLLFSVIAILLIDTYKNVNWREITNEGK